MERLASPPETPDIALSLARHGWPVFPVTIYLDDVGKRHKVPAVKWKAEATTDPKTIAAWWAGEHSGRWIGVYAGEAGDHGIVVLDVDEATKKRTGGVESLTRAGLDVPETFTYPTISGGRHHVYAAPAGIELTIGSDIVGPDGSKLEGVDVRAGSGLMVYYGPELTKAPKLARAPDWLLVTRDRPRHAGGVDRAPNATEDAYRARLSDSKPKGDLADTVRAVEFPDGAAHQPMLDAVAALIGEGAKGTRGVLRLLDETRERYVGNHPDRGRDWDNAVEGSIKRFGLPAVTFEIPKAERRGIAKRNDPAVRAEADAERKKAWRADKAHTKGMSAKKVDRAIGETLYRSDLTDSTLAEGIAAALRDEWAKTGSLGTIQYDGTIWRRADASLLVERCRRILVVVRAFATEEAILRGDKDREKDAKLLEKRTKITDVARLVEGIMLARAPVMDADPDVLNVRNGVVDLRTGALRDRRPDDYFTKVAACNYDPEATSADWRKALKAVPKKVRPWLQIRLGQSATGRISQDKSIPFFIGGGDNGKSAVLGAVRAVLGGYAVKVPDSLLLGADDAHPTDMMTLKGARLAYFEELPKGGRLNAQRVKLLAGTNELTGRYMRADFETWEATHTLAGMTNHLPIVTDVDDAIWARVVPVPFPYKFVSHEPKPGTNQRRGELGLRDRLAEAPPEAVLTWIVEGAVKSYKGLAHPPSIVTDAHDAWRGDADPVLGFTRDRLVLDEDYGVTATDLYAEFGRYLEARGQQRWSDQLIASSFAGHSAIEGVVKRQIRFGGPEGMKVSRPVFTTSPTPLRAMAWVGIRFVEGHRDRPEGDGDSWVDRARRSS